MSDVFLKRIVEKYIFSTEDQEIIYKYFDSPYERTSISMVENIPMDYLMYEVFNNIGKVVFEKEYTYKGRHFSFSFFEGLCDDYYGNRYCKFGNPFVIRVYIDEIIPIPHEVYDMADWNFMNARKEGFLGYIYGSYSNDSIYIAGIQSDLCQRYTYLFGQYTESFYKTNGSVVYIENDLVVDKYKYVIPYIRKFFQREWINILMAAVLQCKNFLGFSKVHLLDYTLSEDDGEIVDRIYKLHFKKCFEDIVTINNQVFNTISLEKLMDMFK